MKTSRPLSNLTCAVIKMLTFENSVGPLSKSLALLAMGVFKIKSSSNISIVFDDFL